MSNLYNKLFKKGLKEIRSSTSGSKLIDRAVHLQSGGFTLVKGEPYVGITAFCLQIAEHFSKKNLVVYVDVNKNLNSDRTQHIKTDNFIFVQPSSHLPVIELASAIFQEFGEPIIFIFDQGSLMPDGGSLEQTAVSLRKINPLNTVIAAEREKYKATDLWGERIFLSFGKRFYYDRELYGHQILVKGGKGKSEHFVSHFTGRLSPGFESAFLEVENGKQKTEVFNYGPVTQKGFWAFLAKVLAKGF